MKEQKRLRAAAKEARAQAAREKKRQKEDLNLARLANQQLQTDLRQSRRGPKRQASPRKVQNREVICDPEPEVKEVPPPYYTPRPANPPSREVPHLIYLQQWILLVK
jgi:hypothetical protein